MIHFNRRLPRSILVLALLSLGSTSAWATTVSIPEALSSGQQIGANAESQTGNSLATMQNQVQTTTGQTAGGANADTGVGNVSATGNPANGVGSETGATGTGSYPFTLSCSKNPPANPIFPGGYGLAAFNCLYSGSGSSAQVTSFTLEYCLAGITGGNCTKGSSNWQSTGIGPGQSVQLSSTVTVSLPSCAANGQGTCNGTVTVQDNQVQQASGGALTNAATNEVLSGSNQLQTTLGNTFNSGNYQTSIQTGNSSYQLNSCTQQIKGGLNGNGIVYTCNGQQSANFGATACSTTEQCVKWATQSSSYTTSCNQDIQLTENTCTTVTPQQNCTISDTTADYNCDDQLQVTVTPGCTPGQVLASGNNAAGGGYLTANGVAYSASCLNYGGPYADYAAYTIVCESGGYLVNETLPMCPGYSGLPTNFESNYMVNASPGSSYSTGYIDNNTGSMCYGYSGNSGLCQFLYTANCSATTCNVTIGFYNSYANNVINIYGTYQVPYQINYNGYSDGCSLYQDAS